MIVIPKPAIGALALVMLGAAGWYYWPEAEGENWLGYVEAETIYVAAPVSGRLAARPVERGANVAAGAPLFALDPETTNAEAAGAAAQVAAASAQVADLSDPRQRAPEIAAARAAEAAAAARLARASNDFDRMAALARKGFASKAQLDAARAARDAGAAELAAARAQIAAGEMAAGRVAQQQAARAQVAGAAASLRVQRQRQREIAPVAPEAGVIEQTYYNPGEWVPANAPVVAVLPDARRKLRFFVPQDRIATLKVGSTVRYGCDGCGKSATARISFIAPRAEFSPPVIYSDRARAKLVFLVEALLPPSAKPLPPGLPVEVTPQ
ncbi:MAG: HlyD family efflux transporter periplasmic adaptor subunit [Sphingomonadaceae bacterium]|nr:HlyD family efflux transporter periplasmic adaptor subunit [Sphingomonadaceae bacterium]